MWIKTYLDTYIESFIEREHLMHKGEKNLGLPPGTRPECAPPVLKDRSTENSYILQFYSFKKKLEQSPTLRSAFDKRLSVSKW